MINVHDILSPKQIEVLTCPPHRHIVIDGSVRSGKTFITLLWLIQDVCYQKAKFDASPSFVDFRRVQAPKIAIIAQTRSTFERNVLDTLKELVGEHNIDMRGFTLTNKFRIMDIDFEYISARNVDFVRRIRGGRFTLIYVDELTLLAETSYNQMLTRCVQEGVRIISTTNPDHPSHYVKRKIIDKADDSTNNIKHFHFVLEDNPTLTAKEIQDFKDSIFDKLIYERYVLGKWVAAEGAVYSFDSSKNVVDSIDFTPATYLLGVDYGVSNPFAASLIACRNPTYDSNLPSMVAIEEVYYDGRAQYSKKSPAEYADIIEDKFFHLKEITDVYVDPSAVAMILELRNRGYRVFPAKNDVSAGIQTVSNLLNSGEFCIKDTCYNTLREMHSYRWNEDHASRTGVEKPIKTK